MGLIRDPTEEIYLMPQERSQPRELTPIQKFWDGSQGMKDYGPRIQKIEEDVEAEEVLTPAPKDLSVLESVDSKESPPNDAQTASERPVPPETMTPTKEPNSDADKENGKRSESNAPAPPIPTAPPLPHNLAPSLQNSSSETSPGKNEPPA